VYLVGVIHACFQQLDALIPCLDDPILHGLVLFQIDVLVDQLHTHMSATPWGSSQLKTPFQTGRTR
jgi:hypothetical protein